MKIDDDKLPGTFPGHRYWKAIQGSVDAILAPMGIKRRVISRGTRFCNYDAWTWIAFTEFLNDEMSKHPGRSPTKSELKDIVRRTNSVKCRDPRIEVARMPDRVSHRVALAIIGGGYHEAWHTKYSKRDKVRLSEIADIVDMIDEVTLAGAKFDEKLRGLLMTMHHLVEDIRIERCGNEDFPGAAQPMRDLQDFVLDLESGARGQNKRSNVKSIAVTSNARSILMCALRDLGLGYNTQKAREMLEYYKKAAPGAVALLAPGGLLAPLLHEATELKADDKMGSLRVAMKIVVALWRATQGSDEDEEKPKLSCPQCGASPKDLVIRAVRDKNGAKVRGLAEMECKVCGFKHKFPLPDASLDFDQSRPEPDEDEERPDVEDLTQDDVDSGDGFGYDQREKAREQQRRHEKQQQSPDDSTTEKGDEQEPGGDEPQQRSSDSQEDRDGDGDEDSDREEKQPQEGASDPQEGAESDEDDPNPLGSNYEDEFDEPDGGGDENDELESISDIFQNSGSDGDGEEDERSRQHGRFDENDEEGDDEEGDEERRPRAAPTMPSRQEGCGEEGAADDDVDADQIEGAGEEENDGEMTGEELLEKLAELGAGGLNLDLGQDPDSFLKQAEDVLDGDDVDGRLDGLDALQQVFESLSKAEARDLQRGEMVWSPWDPMLDEARIIRSNHKDADQRKASEMLAEVRGTVTYLRSRLRMIVRAQEMTDTTHGVRRGRKMSSRMLVDTAIDLRSGKVPTRAFQTTDTQADTSIALALCLDQSGSMWCRVREVSQCMMAMADAMEGIGGKTMAFGFRNGENGSYDGGYNYEKEWHRVCGVRYDVFKTFDEKFVNSKWRFAHTQATGSTPMADGVQFGLTSLNDRREGHRVLCVITDGMPDSPHEKVIARQVRLAKEAGIHVIGVGIGSGAEYVKRLFPDHVWAKTVELLPNPLLKKLNELCDFQGRYRGRKARLDGKITRKVS